MLYIVLCTPIARTSCQGPLLLHYALYSKDLYYIGAVGTWWSGLNREVVSLGAGIGAWWSGLREVVSLGG